MREKTKNEKTHRTICALAAFLTAFSMMSMPASAEIQTYTRNGLAMDTVVTETLYSEGEDICGEVLEILATLDEKYLSWTAGETDIGKINAESGSYVEISEETSGWLEQILEIAKASDGALDPTMGKVIALWDIDGENPHIPTESELAPLMKHVGYEKVTVDGTKVKLEEGTSLNLGAEGKGIGCDKVMDYLRGEKEVSGALVNLGGSSVMSYGSKPDGTPWRIAITDPRDNHGDYLGVVALGADEFLSTSGDYEKFFIEDGVRYHHIMDPKTGAPARTGLAAVTVVAKNGLTADALSTACMVLGKEKSLELLAKYEAEALFVEEDHTLYVTDGMKSRFTLMKEGYSFN